MQTRPAGPRSPPGRRPGVPVRRPVRTALDRRRTEEFLVHHDGPAEYRPPASNGDGGGNGSAKAPRHEPAGARPCRDPFRRRLRRRHAAHRDPVHDGELAVRQRHRHDAGFPGRDPRACRDSRRGLGVPGPHLRPRHPHRRRRAERARRDEPRGASGEHLGRVAWRHSDSEHRRLRTAEPGQGRIQGEPPHRRQLERLHGVRGADDLAHLAGGQRGGRKAPRGRAGEELLRARRRQLAVQPSDRRDPRVDHEALRRLRLGSRRQHQGLQGRLPLRRDRRALRVVVPGAARCVRARDLHRRDGQHRTRLGSHRRFAARGAAAVLGLVPDHAGVRHPPRAVQAQALRGAEPSRRRTRSQGSPRRSAQPSAGLSGSPRRAAREST